MTLSFSKTFCFGLAMLAPASARLSAQETVLPAPLAATWADAREQRYPAGADIVTVAEPTVRQPCKIKSFHDDAIVCKRSGKPALTFRRDAVQAILVRRYEDSAVRSKVLGVGIGGSIIYGAILLAGLGPLGIVGAIVVAFDGLFAGMLIAYCGDGCPTHPERLAYLQAGTTLQVAVQ